MLKADVYDNFVTKNPGLRLSLPTSILLYSVELGTDKLKGTSKNLIASECKNCDDLIDKWACAYCVLGAISVSSGCPAGLLELAACVECYISMKNYAECKEEQKKDNLKWEIK